MGGSDLSGTAAAGVLGVAPSWDLPLEQVFIPLEFVMSARKRSRLVGLFLALAVVTGGFGVASAATAQAAPSDVSELSIFIDIVWT